jgi:hypothetical protein
MLCRFGLSSTAFSRSSRFCFVLLSVFQTNASTSSGLALTFVEAQPHALLFPSWMAILARASGEGSVTLLLLICSNFLVFSSPRSRISSSSAVYGSEWLLIIVVRAELMAASIALLLSKCLRIVLRNLGAVGSGGGGG